jgi:hypothetical protein
MINIRTLKNPTFGCGEVFSGDLGIREWRRWHLAWSRMAQGPLLPASRPDPDVRGV